MAATAHDVIETQIVTETESLTPTNRSEKEGPVESVEAHLQPSSACNGPGDSQPNDTTREDNAQYPGGWRLIAILASLCLGTLLVAIDNTIIGVAIPKISAVFHALDDVGWYGSAYLLTVTALQPIFGNIYKYFNIKATYIVSVVVFESEWKASCTPE